MAKKPDEPETKPEENKPDESGGDTPAWAKKILEILTQNQPETSEKPQEVQVPPPPEPPKKPEEEREDPQPEPPEVRENPLKRAIRYLF